MEYTCELANVNKYIYSPKGIQLPLCNSCLCGDCTNPIEYMEYSVYGVPVKCRIYKRGTTPYFVVACSGFLTEEQMHKEEKEIEQKIESVEDEEKI